MPTILINNNWSLNGDPGQFSYTVTDEGAIEMAVPVAHSVTNLQIALAFVRAGVRCLEMRCSKALSIFTNATDGTGGDHISLPANGCWAWHDLSGIALSTILPGGDVTKIYANNAGGDATFDTTLYIRGIRDSTP